RAHGGPSRRQPTASERALRARPAAGLASCGSPGGSPPPARRGESRRGPQSPLPGSPGRAGGPQGAPPPLGYRGRLPPGRASRHRGRAGGVLRRPHRRLAGLRVRAARAAGLRPRHAGPRLAAAFRRGRVSRRGEQAVWIGLAVLVAGALVLAVSTLRREEHEMEVGFQGEARANPLLAAERFLREMRIPATSSGLAVLPGTDHALVLTLPA